MTDAHPTDLQQAPAGDGPELPTDGGGSVDDAAHAAGNGTLDRPGEVQESAEVEQPAEVEQRVEHGWQVLRISTDRVVLDLIPGLGGTITSLRRADHDAELLWRTPWGLRPLTPTMPGNAEATMLDHFPGGWQTLFPNGGDTAHAHGVEWGYNGEARLAPFDWQLEDGSVIMSTRLVRSPFRITKTVTVRGGTVTVEETVTNEGAESVEVMWGHQVVLGPPLLAPETVIESGATIVHPDPTVTSGANYNDVMPWPRSIGENAMINLRRPMGPNADEARMAYLTDFSEPRITVRNPALDLGLELTWDAESWPYAWYSQESGSRRGFPWFGSGYFLALTPASSWPAHGIHDARRISKATVWVEPDEARSSRLDVTVLPPGR